MSFFVPIILFTLVPFTRAAQIPVLSIPFGDAQRLSHARELLGKAHYGKIILPTVEVKNVNQYIQKWLEFSLKPPWKKYETAIFETLMSQSKKYQFDPIFLMAMIQIESGFNPDAEGGAGEIGLMQLKPSTAKWLCKLKGIRWRGNKTLRDPVFNIQLGAFLLTKLRRQFDADSRLYLAAYNMGSSRVQRAVDKNIRPKDYPLLVMEHYISYYRNIHQLQVHQPSS